MRKNKLVVIAIAAMLAMCVGLTACGGSNSASSSAASSSAASSSAEASSAEASSAEASSAEASSAEASSAEASSAASDSTAASSSAEVSSTTISKAIFWKGTLSDGSTVCYAENEKSGEVALLVANSDFSKVSLWAGPVSCSSDGVFTITDTQTKKDISFTISDINSTSFTIDLKDYGEVELKSITEADIKAYGEQLAAVVASEGEKFLKEIEEAGKALEKELTEAAEKVSKEVEKVSNEYENMDEATVLFWNGKLADDKDVVFMDDPESGEAFLSITKADLSDGEVWFGKYTASKDEKVVTITDEETGKTVVYEIVEITPGKSMKISVKGYGEANLESVTKGDFTKLTDELAKSMDESAAK